MSVRARSQRRLTRFIAPCATLLICAYFGFHATHGQYGTRAHLVMKARIAKLEARLDATIARRAVLEARVAALQDGTIEKDMLDEQIRAQLAMSHADEIVLLH